MHIVANFEAEIPPTWAFTGIINPTTIIKEIIIDFVFIALNLELLNFDAVFVQSRITSYNVCYTKLLRLHDIGIDRSAILSEARAAADREFGIPNPDDPAY